MSKSLVFKGETVDINYSWQEFLTDEILDELKNIENKIGDNFTPQAKNVLRFLKTDLDKSKVIFLGQDPYPQPGVATGRAFEVGGLNSWDTPFRQVSLKNIVRLIHKNYNGITEYKDIKKFSEIVKEIKSCKFDILSPNLLFYSLEQQGVLFLNTYLTCEANESNSHRNIWEEFSIKLFRFISQKRPDIIWFLWGSEAISKQKYIKDGIIYKSRHPMLCAEKFPDDFLKSNCFKETMDKINWLGEIQ